MIKEGDKVRLTDERKILGFADITPEWVIDSIGTITRNYGDGCIKVEFTSKNGEKYSQNWSPSSFGLEGQ
jgi:hypothetical protein